uniref:Armadillo repeat-containing protein 7 n=1 Tax=Cacopsylla melanoneura TaxID=428564 RepID=A0A8D8WP87_9HEMI
MYYTTVSLDAKEQVLANLSNFAYDPINYDYMRRLNVIDIFLDTISRYTLYSETLVHYAMAGLCNLCLDKTNKEYILSRAGVHSISNLLVHSDHEHTLLDTITSLMYLITPLSKPEITSPAVIARLLEFINPVSTSPSLTSCQLSTNPGDFDSSIQPSVNPSSSYREENSAQSPRQPSVYTSSQPSGHPSSQRRPEDGGNLAQSLASAGGHPSSPTSAHSSRLANLAQIFLADYCTRDQISAVQRIVSTSQIPLPDTNE